MRLEDFEVPKITSAGAVTYLREQLEFAVDAFLRSRGFESTSLTPGCLWLWRAVLEDGTVLLVSKDTALYMADCWQPKKKRGG